MIEVRTLDSMFANLNSKIEMLESKNKSLKDEIEYKNSVIENYPNYLNDKIFRLEQENNQLKNDYVKLENRNEGLHKELSDHRLDGQIIKSLQDDKKQLIAEVEKLQQVNKDLESENKFKKDKIFKLQGINEDLKKELKTLESKYNELKSQYDMGLIYSIKDGVVMTKKYDDLNEKEKNYKRCLNRVFENNGFLVQLFSDYSNLQYCYDNFIKHGFEVHQVGSDTLIIRNKK